VAVELLVDAMAAVRVSRPLAAADGATDFEAIRRHARRSLGKFINESTRRRPAVIPVVMEV
jgi:mRNA degradation ribonuclease J1/J2